MPPVHAKRVQKMVFTEPYVYCGYRALPDHLVRDKAERYDQQRAEAIPGCLSSYVLGTTKVK